MSRIGKKPVILPKEVKVELKEREVKVRGPKGELFLVLPFGVRVELNEDQHLLTVSVLHPEEQKDRALWGTMRSLIANMVQGVFVGFKRTLEIIGVGYRANIDGRKIVLDIGFSHSIAFPLPEGIEAVMEKNILTISGIDKQLVGEVAAEIRRLRKPEPYKGTGIKYTEEIIRRKVGKKAAKSA